jgi:hypothetical protein
MIAHSAYEIDAFITITWTVTSTTFQPDGCDHDLRRRATTLIGCAPSTVPRSRRVTHVSPRAGHQRQHMPPRAHKRADDTKDHTKRPTVRGVRAGRPTGLAE